MTILGHERVRARLWRAADDNRLHHCLLFEGPEGVGKSLVAREFVLYVNCEAVERPCRACRSCRMLMAGTHPDHVVVGPDPERATAVISAGQARAVVGALQLQRHSARRRFVTLDPADILTEEAGNILLKTLEEPPEGTGFILVSARPAALLQTVRSRSQRVRFGPVSDAAMAAWGAEHEIAPDVLRAAFGSPGLALRLAEGEAATRDEVALALLDTLGQPLIRLLAFTEAQSKHSDGTAERARLVLDVLAELMRDVALIGGGRPERLLHPQHEARLRRWARGLWPDGLGRVERVLALAGDRREVNVNGRIVLEAVLSAVNLELSQVPA